MPDAEKAQKLKTALIETFGQEAWTNFVTSFGKAAGQNAAAIGYELRDLKAKSGQPEFCAK